MLKNGPLIDINKVMTPKHSPRNELHWGYIIITPHKWSYFTPTYSCFMGAHFATLWLDNPEWNPKFTCLWMQIPSFRTPFAPGFTDVNSKPLSKNRGLPIPRKNSSCRDSKLLQEILYQLIEPKSNILYLQMSIQILGGDWFTNPFEKICVLV